MSELTPPGSNAYMTPAQIKKYMKKMREAQAIAEAKIKEAEKSWELNEEKEQIEDLANLLEENDLYI